MGAAERPWPQNLPIGAVRIWDNGVRWTDLQPTSSAWSESVLHKLDVIVDTARAHGAEPLLVLGMTPEWAAAPCRHVIAGTDWGVATCPPVRTGTDSAWAGYIRFLATRYKGRVHYFETWNEPNLLNGFNGTPRQLAALLHTAHSVLRSVDSRDRLVSPSIAITCCDPIPWLDNFLSQPGATDFDIFGIHLYPAPHQMPEWSLDDLARARQVLQQHGVHAPVWDTEVDVGRKIAHETYSGVVGAGLLARIYILAAVYDVRRTFWYAAQDHTWSGIQLEKSDYRTRTAAGVAYGVVRSWLVGSTVSCARPTTAVWSCNITRRTGAKELITWTTGPAVVLHLPAALRHAVSVTGAQSPVTNGSVRLTGQPVLLRS